VLLVAAQAAIAPLGTVELVAVETEPLVSLCVEETERSILEAAAVAAAVKVLLTSAPQVVAMEVRGLLLFAFRRLSLTWSEQV
jgi:hypothetical protein